MIRLSDTLLKPQVLALAAVLALNWLLFPDFFDLT